MFSSSNNTLRNSLSKPDNGTMWDVDATLVRTNSPIVTTVTTKVKKASILSCCMQKTTSAPTPSSAEPSFTLPTLDSWELAEAVDSWEKGETDTISYTEKGQMIYAPGTVPGGPNIGQPVFQFKQEPKTPIADGGLMVAESENCVSFIPGGFRGGKTVNTMNPVREAVGGPSALMSLVHVVTIPKDKRIYNASTLKAEHKPLLQEMKELGEKAALILLKGPKTMPGSFKWVYSQSGMLEMNDGQTKSMKVVESDLSPSCQTNYHKAIKRPELRNSFHVGNAASIGYLHLHTYIGNILTTAHDSMEREAAEKGYAKNTPFEVVVNSL
jgi:hypothetical protein